MQEAFTAVWRSAESYRPERGSAGGWLYTVARNAIVDRMRRNGRADTTAELPELASPEGGPDEQAEEADTAWRVHRALEELNAERARGDRARVLERAVPERGGELPRPAARDREDADAKRARAACARCWKEKCGERDFDELVGAETTGAERERLRGVHELLVEAGPPPELPRELEEGPPSPATCA